MSIFKLIPGLILTAAWLAPSPAVHAGLFDSKDVKACEEFYRSVSSGPDPEDLCENDEFFRLSSKDSYRQCVFAVSNNPSADGRDPTGICKRKSVREASERKGFVECASFENWIEGSEPCLEHGDLSPYAENMECIRTLAPVQGTNAYYYCDDPDEAELFEIPEYRSCIVAASEMNLVPRRTPEFRLRGRIQDRCKNLVDGTGGRPGFTRCVSELSPYLKDTELLKTCTNTEFLSLFVRDGYRGCMVSAVALSHRDESVPDWAMGRYWYSFLRKRAMGCREPEVLEKHLAEKASRMSDEVARLGPDLPLRGFQASARRNKESLEDYAERVESERQAHNESVIKILGVAMDRSYRSSGAEARK